ncbi:MAG: LPS-assembly protein LptD, partial [Spongiibacteraceae bacterium]|nr:LPS-assembly protein LptD [Spongiibacteraceae bacterium]
MDRKALAQAVAAPASGSFDWDWVPLTAEEMQVGAQCCAPGNACGGYYREPAADWADADRQPEGLPVRANAAESQWQGDTVTLTGGMVVTQGNMKLTADGGQYNRSSNNVKLRGAVEIRQPGLVIAGDTADVATGTGFGAVENARFLDYKSGSRATASVLARTQPDVIELETASFTQCPPGQEDWQLTAGHVTLNQSTGRGVARHSVLRLGGLPVFYSPYLNFPIDDRRQTGFLWPTIATTSDGLDLSAPFYLNLAANYDATITPRLVTDRGAMLESEIRYLNSWSTWRATGAYLPDDDEFADDRWLAGLYHSGRVGQHWATSIDYTRVSDEDYFEDLSLASLDVKRQSHLTQQAAATFFYDQWRAQIQVRQYQVVDLFVAEPYRQLPRLSLQRLGGGTNFALDYSFYGEATAFDNRDSIEAGGRFVTGNRYYAEPGISFPMRWTAGYIEPEVRLRHVSYDLDETAPGASRTPSATVPLAIVDAGLFFERELSSGYEQTLEPRLYYLYSEFDDQSDQPRFDTNPVTFNYQQLFSPRRFIGRDRLEDFDQLSVGLTSRFINPVGREVLSGSIGQTFYFDEREITLLNRPGESERSRSSVAAQLNWQPLDSLWATANALWDRDNDLVEQASFAVHYATEQQAVFNLGYRYRRQDPAIVTLTETIDQVDASAAIPLGMRWQLFARWNYDLNDNSSLENTIGVQYDDCCWRVRVLYQRAIE